MNRKIFSIFLVVLMMLTLLTACGEKTSSQPENSVKEDLSSSTDVNTETVVFYDNEGSNKKVELSYNSDMFTGYTSEEKKPTFATITYVEEGNEDNEIAKSVELGAEDSFWVMFIADMKVLDFYNYQRECSDNGENYEVKPIVSNVFDNKTVYTIITHEVGNEDDICDYYNVIEFDGGIIIVTFESASVTNPEIVSTLIYESAKILG